MSRLFTVSKIPPQGRKETSNLFLSLNRDKFKEAINDEELTAAIMGVSYEGDLQHIFNTKTFEDGNTTLIGGNLSNLRREFTPGVVRFDNVGSFFHIDELEKIPPEIRPTTALTEDLVAETSFANAEVPLGFTIVKDTSILPFGTPRVPHGKSNDKNVVDSLSELSVHHGYWIKSINDARERDSSVDEDIKEVYKRIVALGNQKGQAYVPQFPQGVAFHVPRTGVDFMFRVVTDPTQYPELRERIGGESGFFHPIPTPQPAQEEAGPEPEDMQIPVFSSRNQESQSGSNVLGNELPLPHDRQQQQRPYSDASTSGFGFGVSSAPARPFLPQQRTMNNIFVKDRAEVDREELGSFGLSRLFLYGIGMKINWENGTVDNITLPKWASAFRTVIASPNPTWQARMKSLLSSFFNMKLQGALARDPMYTLRSMRLFTTPFVNAILHGNFSTQDLERLSEDPTQLNVMHFAAQNLKDKVAIVTSREMNAQAETQNNVIDIHRTRATSTIDVLGRVQVMDDVVAICANYSHVLRAIFAIAEMEKTDAPPALYSFLEFMVSTIYDPDISIWMKENLAKMEFLPFIFLKMIQVFAKAVATVMDNALNTHALESPDLSPESIDVDPIRKAVKAVVAWKRILDEKVTLGTVFAASDKPNMAFIADAVAGNESKTDPAPTSNKKPAAASPPAKKPPAKRTKGSGPKPKLNEEKNRKLGLFHLNSVGGSEPRFADAFPLALPENPCFHFLFQGKNCTNEFCQRKHISRWSDFGTESQSKILAKLQEKKLAYFDEDTIGRHGVSLPTQYCHLVGDSNGIKSTSS